MASKLESGDSKQQIIIGENTPAEDFQKLIKEHVEECDDDEMKASNFEKYSEEIRKVINSMLFKTTETPKEKIQKALKIYREEACFYNPYDYNDWIKEIKTKLIEKKMLDIWENIIVKNQLGLLWARDCDFFDDMEDKEPLEFYKIKDDNKEASSTKDRKDSDSKRIKLSEEKKSPEKSTKITSADHYCKLIKERVEEIDPDEDDKKMDIFDDLSEQVRKILTDSILQSTVFDYNKISKDLKLYRDKACFYNPYDYNDWIKEIKIKLIEKKMLDIWENVIVKNQLGLLWARDCDFFDDMEDKEPLEFYKIKDDNKEASSTKDTKDSDSKSIKLSEEKKSPEKPTKITSADHYCKLIKERVEEIDPDEDDKKMDIFDDLSEQVRKILTDSILQSTAFNYNKISRDLKLYRDKACFYNPYDYNDWIKEIKVKLLERKMNDCWEKVIVKNELGLLSAKDCDLFDDMDDDEPENFYKNDKKTKNKVLDKVGIETPAKDYEYLIEEQVEEIDPDREDEKMDIFDDLSKQIQNIICELLFDKETPEINKITEALKVYREKACFYNPYDYNDWIKEIKEKIIEKKMVDFWQNVIVKNKLGLLWARDCDFFDDMDDEEPEKFYKIPK